MRRLNPFGSFFGFLLTILLLTGLGISLWVNRGLAFNPGPVTAIEKEGKIIQGFNSHADFEKQCVYCHEPLKAELASKCKDCHLEVDRQVQIGEGVHSHISEINQCEACHPEHRGRSFNPTEAAYQLFDHSATGFNLNWHQHNYDAAPMGCKTCHLNDNFSIVENNTCFECHNGKDTNIGLVHIKDFGTNCLDCHDGVDRMQSFDHSQVGFLLDGKHSQITCTECHNTADIKGVLAECVGCHSEPMIHLGLFNSACNLCHTSDAWSPAIFDGEVFSHFSNTGFSLDLHQVDYENNVIACNTCHNQSLKTIDLLTCIDCHSADDQEFMVEHVQQFGKDCLVCHDGVDRLSNFTHEAVFPLDGKHAEIQCADCHVNNVYRGTTAECWQCHQEPDLHAGLFGLECANCHTAKAWSPAILENHIFPLDHGLEGQNLQSLCNVCHTTSYIDYTCYNCHEHIPDEILVKHLEEGISEQNLPKCAECHPTGSEHETGED